MPGPALGPGSVLRRRRAAGPSALGETAFPGDALVGLLGRTARILLAWWEARAWEARLRSRGQNNLVGD